MKPSPPVVKDLVLIGGGHSHVGVLRSFGMKPVAGARITLITRDVDTPYSGMLPGLIAGHYTFDEAHIDLGPLARFARARLYHDEVVGIDLVARRIQCVDRPPVPYDLLSINIGSTPWTDVPGATEHAVPVKPIDRFFKHWQQLVERLVDSDEPRRVVVVGGGAGGVEICLAAQYRIRALLRERGVDGERVSFGLVTAGKILPGHNSRVQSKFHKVLEERGVELHLDTRIVRVEANCLHTEAGDRIEADEILWCTNASAAPWLGETGLATDDDGFIAVEDTLRSTSHSEVFAAGDIAAVLKHPRPKSGVFAVRQGPPLTENLRRALTRQPLEPFVPQKAFLSLISTGDKYAIASRGAWSAEGERVWKLKDWIDRRFMSKYNDLPDMAEESTEPDLAAGIADNELIRLLGTQAMRCGGCGAKVGADVLGRALDKLQPVDRDEVLVGLRDPDDAAVIDIGGGMVMVQSVDSFRTMIDDPYMFGRLAANHALGDVYAMGAEPQTALAIVTLPFGQETKVEADLEQLMAGAMRTLREARCALVGGHTAEGAELSLGFAVNGIASADDILTKGGLEVGDCLIVSKAVGTGTLFAADMRAKAKGRWIIAALDSMIQSNREAAAILHRHGAHACTDVTGFGLIGHLVEMIEGSKTEVAVEFSISALPVLQGALECVRANITSSLQPHNIRLRRAIANVEAFADDDRMPLLFDPQTAGGLLASVPATDAAEALEELIAAGYQRAAIIGTVKALDDDEPPIRLVR